MITIDWEILPVFDSIKKIWVVTAFDELHEDIMAEFFVLASNLFLKKEFLINLKLKFRHLHIDMDFLLWGNTLKCLLL